MESSQHENPNLMQRLNKPLRQFVKYFSAALAGYVVDFSLLIFCTEVLNLHYILAAIIGFIAGLIVVYLLSNKYVFGTSKLKSRTAEFGIFAVIGIVGLFLLTALMWILTDLANINYIFSKIVATIIVYMWNFFARKSLYHD